MIFVSGLFANFLLFKIYGISSGHDYSLLGPIAIVNLVAIYLEFINCVTFCNNRSLQTAHFNCLVSF